MKKILIVPFLFLYFHPVFAQIQFEPGFFVDNQGQKSEVLIQNKDWLNNPSEFRYKVNSGSADISTARLEEVSEFKVGNFHYVRSTVELDKSKAAGVDVSSSRQPEFEEEILFLRTLVLGDASLYMFKDGSLIRFFSRQDDKGIKPLVYKRFRLPGGMAENNAFRQQLLEDFNCGGLEPSDLSELEYKTKDLVEFFTTYNSCVNSEFVSYFQKEKNQGKFRVALQVGVGHATMAFEEVSHASAGSFSEVEPRIGLELEYLLPFNKNKWGIFSGAVYRQFTTERETSNQFRSSVLQVKYSSVEVLSGLRHYFFLNNKHKLFLNAGLLIDLPLESQIILLETGRVRDPEVTDLESPISPMLGLGAELFNRFTMELRYNKREVSGQNYVPTHFDLDWQSDYSTVSLMIGYKFL